MQLILGKSCQATVAQLKKKQLDALLLQQSCKYINIYSTAILTPNP